MKIVMIGAGNVAVHLAPLFAGKKHKVIQVYSRSKKSAASLSKKLKCDFTIDVSRINQNADLYIIALRDQSITTFLSQLTFIPSLIVHTSGSLDITVFPKSFISCGVMYPLQTFTKNADKSPEVIPFCIEASDKNSLAKVEKFAKSISRMIYRINSNDRAMVHLAAVFANNFTNYLFIQAEKILRPGKISFNILQPLIDETVRKAIESSPMKSQTGPAKRGDSIIIRKHLKLLKDHPEAKHIYSLLSKSIENDFGPLL